MQVDEVSIGKDGSNGDMDETFMGMEEHKTSIKSPGGNGNDLHLGSAMRAGALKSRNRDESNEDDHEPISGATKAREGRVKAG